MGLRKPKLLCIDDDSQGLQVRKMLLEAFDFDVVTHTSPRQALRLFQLQSFDAVVVDYQMPDMNGDEVAAELKRLDSLIPVVMLSALQWLPEGTPQNYDLYLTKSESGADLSRKIHSLLEERQSKSVARGKTPIWRKGSALAGVVTGIVIEGVAERRPGRGRNVSHLAPARAR